MPDSGKPARGAKRSGKAGASGKRADAPSPGAAALNEALAELAMSPPGGGATGASAPNGGPAAAGQSQATSPAKTVAQVLGEITWLMTQSPRHKAIALGDLEWLVMPAILLRQFRIFY